MKFTPMLTKPLGVEFFILFGVGVAEAKEGINLGLIFAIYQELVALRSFSKKRKKKILHGINFLSSLDIYGMFGWRGSRVELTKNKLILC